MKNWTHVVLLLCFLSFGRSYTNVPGTCGTIAPPSGPHRTSLTTTGNFTIRAPAKFVPGVRYQIVVNGPVGMSGLLIWVQNSTGVRMGTFSASPLSQLMANCPGGSGPTLGHTTTFSSAKMTSIALNFTAPFTTSTVLTFNAVVVLTTTTSYNAAPASTTLDSTVTITVPSSSSSSIATVQTNGTTSNTESKIEETAAIENNDEVNQQGPLSTGAIIGIAVAGVVLILLVGMFFFAPIFYARQKGDQRRLTLVPPNKDPKNSTNNGEPSRFSLYRAMTKTIIIGTGYENQP
eukprot:TRINITY_DN2752_c0_g1_i2.p1 TRINITY_DN2752_c0_g1~~TRINITY_DN2752_c0_g1_i2.p1  ORF type:complete len:291 (+),score=69.28 TRINITY_DN2752_c0_g1_i2:3-875(+)